MRAFVVSGPRQTDIVEVEPPRAGPGQVVVDVALAGVCGTDVEIFTGELAYLHDGRARYPVRLGHEWCGTVSALGEGTDPSWLGRRVTGDTMIGCGACRRCLAGRHWLCQSRSEIGIRGSVGGALAEQLALPAAALHELPDTVDDRAAALVEPGANALRAVLGAGLSPGQRLLVMGLGTIGLVAAMFARSRGVEVHVLGRSQRSLDRARALCLDRVWRADELPDLAWDAIIDATNDPDQPALALDLVEPGGRIVYIGLAGEQSRLDARSIVFKEVTAVGILGGSAGLAETIEAYGSGTVDPRPLIAGIVGLDRVGDVLAGWEPEGVLGSKILVDPRA
ncbi:MAG: alcohol dehydrogenase catalytic domain-containing protein [Chloroflexi bacterium]|nr:alcohol dehydrogenase catalytic domain-containing protein [Chloroflexota bacterium]